MNNIEYNQALDWLYNQVPNYQKIGNSAYKPGLDNISKLMNLYDNPQEKIKTIHIAGTNGKGSVSHSLSSILQEAGYKVGLFTSPHLKNFSERIKINAIECSEDFIYNQIIKIKNENIDFQPSFFELTTAFAFEYFFINKVDIAIIEVGLGGRLDSTNIINPEVCAITSISYDHQDILGEKIEDITYEKSGIIKENVPIVIGEQNDYIIEIIKKYSQEKNAEVIINNSDFLETDLKGFYQIQNQKTTIGIIQTLQNKNWKITENNIKKGLKNIVKNTNLMGRWQTIQSEPLIICDTGHNKAAFKIIINQLLEYNKKIKCILGFVKGKDIEKIISLLPKNFEYIFTKPNIQRALNPFEYEDLIKKYNLNYKIYDSVLDSFNKEKNKLNKDEILFIGGSNFVVAEVL